MPSKIDFEASNVESELLEAGSTIDDAFESEDPEFTDYYMVQSQYDLQEGGLARTYLLKVDSRAMWHASVAMAHLRKETTEETPTKESDGNIPAVLISHLSAHKDSSQGKNRYKIG